MRIFSAAHGDRIRVWLNGTEVTDLAYIAYVPNDPMVEMEGFVDMYTTNPPTVGPDEKPLTERRSGPVKWATYRALTETFDTCCPVDDSTTQKSTAMTYIDKPYIYYHDAGHVKKYATTGCRSCWVCEVCGRRGCDNMANIDFLNTKIVDRKVCTLAEKSDVDLCQQTATVSVDDLITIMHVANRGSFKRTEPSDSEQETFKRLHSALMLAGVSADELQQRITMLKE